MGFLLLHVFYIVLPFLGFYVVTDSVILTAHTLFLHHSVCFLRTVFPWVNIDICIWGQHMV
jgi:hypothetical protein